MLKTLLHSLVRSRNAGRASLQPDDSAAAYDSALAAFNAGGFAEAEALARRSVSLERTRTDAWTLLGAILLKRGHAGGAVQAFQEAVDLDPQQVPALANLAEALRLAKRYGDAETTVHAALAIDPSNPVALHMLALALADQWRADEAWDVYEALRRNAPTFLRAHSSQLFFATAQRCDDAVLCHGVHREWGARHADPITAASPSSPRRSRGDRLHIGYVSADFNQHSMAQFVEPILRHHRRDHFEVTCFSNTTVTDETTARLRGIAEHWQEIAGLDDTAAADLIRDSRVDVLVDLSGHTRGNRLAVFARRPAPVQVTYLGYINTTGMAAMDYRLTDAIADPEGVDGYYTERLLRLPNSQWCFPEDDRAPPVAASPAEASGVVTFGCFCSTLKLRADWLAVWAGILDALPASRLVVGGIGDPGVAGRVRAVFDAVGIAPDRVILKPSVAYTEYLRAHGEIDIVLDTYPCSGATPTCHALWMGVPVVTRAGLYGPGRSSASILTAAGLPELVTDSAGSFVATALDLARDVPRLAALRGGMRDRVARSPLGDAAAFTRDLEAAYERAFVESTQGATS